ncbi:phosphopantothenoylcysteine decarboxylase [Candidatus Epulonipiscium fishelsonii]|uniref:Phosphopantothenoylcysteine decarboxylase n=1 Tax=Candidatus Epulonipiscium fishelsonii TaxID=77094 RepID=A0ACC8XE39_9FIRM|nr:phosphopantothenoylcysteine decarboxylase [Epulopiscium sp. SCG-B05WGA-EpuloA1]ONI41075.1 phosphopantothenoylcysteine decarboxylase [Epulopiscium sp. SCG-B11WGA-EpuloA1]
MKKHIIVGISGGIAVYKALDLISKLKKSGYDITVVMTENATKFVNPISFEIISQNYVVKDTFENYVKGKVEHIELAKSADLLIVVPATANIIGKVANGIADDILSTTILATKATKIFAPAMNTMMYENDIVQDNIKYLKTKGYKFIEPASGMLACGDVGKGKLPSTDIIYDYITSVLNINQDLKDRTILITAGPTIEPIDPMRYITNHSTGKMGYSIAQCAINRGANVILISGPTNLDPPPLAKVINIKTANEMYTQVHKYFNEADIVIKTAAVADYRPELEQKEKIKKSDDNLTLKLVSNKDILKSLGEIKKDKVLVGFAAETRDLITYAKEKILKKNLDFIVANDISREGAGFGVDTNIASIIKSNDEIISYPKISKSELADIILTEAKSYLPHS